MVARVRVVSAAGFSACCAAVSGSGMRASTFCAAGDGVVESITAPAALTAGTGTELDGLVAAVPVDAGGADAVVGFAGVVVIGAQPHASAIAMAASVEPGPWRAIIPGSCARAPPR